MACCTVPSCLLPQLEGSLCISSPPLCGGDPAWPLMAERLGPEPRSDDLDAESSCSSSASSSSQPAALSRRGRAHASKHTPFWDTFDTLLSNPYCREINPTGFINMGIANNSLMSAELLTYFYNHLNLEPIDLTYGSSLYGSIRLFKALCHYLNGPDFAPIARVEPHHILTGPGAGAILDQIVEHLADPGDGIMCAAPYYNGFDADLATRSQVHCVPVFSPDGDGSEANSFTGPTALRGFAAAYDDSEAAGVPIKAILICNPHNPLGKCYDRAALVEYGRFAARRGLHLVFDEIYALSVFPTEDCQDPQGFISALSIDWEGEAGLHPGSVHVVSSASKDWGLNGFRIGMLISQHNSRLISAMKSTSKLYMVSSPADALFSHLLLDETFYRPFVNLNRARLSAAYALVRSWCRHHAIPYTPSNAGHFVLVDLSAHLDGDASAAQAEALLWSKILEHHVSITPGSNYHHPTPGIFRVTFSLKRDDVLEGLARLERALGLQPWSP